MTTTKKKRPTTSQILAKSEEMENRRRRLVAEDYGHPYFLRAVDAILRTKGETSMKWRVKGTDGEPDKAQCLTAWEIVKQHDKKLFDALERCRTEGDFAEFVNVRVSVQPPPPVIQQHLANNERDPKDKKPIQFDGKTWTVNFLTREDLTAKIVDTWHDEQTLAALTSSDDEPQPLEPEPDNGNADMPFG